MSEIVIASTQEDAAAAAAVEQHHAELAGALAVRVQAVLDSVRGDDDRVVRAAAEQLVRWCGLELLPHAAAEEETLYAAARARPEGRLLVDGMLTEHTVIGDLVEEIAGARTSLATATAARALQVVVDNHLAKENSLVLPLLVTAPDIRLAALLHGLHELVGGPSGHDVPADGHDGQERHGDHACGCGETDGTHYPELDARVIPHAIRHATIFGALDAIRPGSGLVLVAPHDPKPLLAQVARRSPDTFTVEYLQRGPEDWRLAFVRHSA